MKTRVLALACILVAATAYPQDKPQKPAEDQVIRIGTKLVQLDAVVVDKGGKIVRGLGQNDFELYEGGKKQEINFFEFVEAGGLAQSGRPGQEHPAPKPAEPSRQGPGEGDIR